jgi:hypothetical protein
MDENSGTKLRERSFRNKFGPEELKRSVEKIQKR